jgi:fused signal recognition particle receptor
MFESLKNKLKGIFNKAPEVEELDKVYDAPAAEPADEGPQAELVKEGPALSRKEKAKLDRQKHVKADDENVVSEHGKRIKEGTLDDLLWDLQLALLEADVAVPVAEEIRKGVRETLVGKKHSRDHTLGEIVETSVKDAIRDVLKINEFDFDAWIEGRERPTSVMFIGINGTGKTTAIAKIAYRLMGTGKTVVLAAGDTFRAGAIEQLTIHADRLGCRIVKHSPDSDPAAVAFDAIEHAKAKRRDVVLIDTAGRMQTNSNLLDEMKKIARVAKPDLKVFVGDSLAGNDAVEQARAFDAAVGIDSVILTKIDADSKGGAALSIAHTIGKPIAFVSNGQGYDELIKFSTEWMVARLFD